MRRLLTLTVFLVAFITTGVTQVRYTIEWLKDYYDFDNWPGLTSDIKQPLNLLEGVEAYLGLIKNSSVRLYGGSAICEAGEITWTAYDNSNMAKEVMLRSYEYSTLDDYELSTILDSLQYNIIGDVMSFNRLGSYNQSPYYTISVSRNNYMFGVTTSDSFLCVQVAQAMVNRIDAAPSIVSLDDSPSLPYISEVRIPDDFWQREESRRAWIEFVIPAGPDELVETSFRAWIGEWSVVNPGFRTVDGYRIPILCEEIPMADHINLRARLMNNRGERTDTTIVLEEE
ncbi:hypothetical protein KQI63_07690 [bacterium]|nr:hypothetical protein [bacterium]